MARIEGKVAAILDDSTIIVNLGAKDGIVAGDKVHLYEELRVRDPDTKSELGRIQRVWGTLTVSQVERRYCVARTAYVTTTLWTTTSVLDFFNQPHGYYRKLPVDEQEITKENYKVRVGGSVYVDKPSAEGTEDITGNDQGATGGPSTAQ